MKLKNTKSINFSDVNLLSEKLSVVDSRTQVTFNTNRIIVAPMAAIQNSGFNISAITAGLSLPIHRFCTVEEQHRLLMEAIATRAILGTKSLIWLSVGLNDWEKRIGPVYQQMAEAGVGVLFDVANGYAKNLEKAVNAYKQKFELPNLMTGNVHTWAGFQFLEDLGSDFVRVGVGNGQACETSTATGIARGQISCIEDVADQLHLSSLISDGGIRSPADVAKAFGAGADYVMIGGYFSAASESEAQKTGFFYGGASAMQKEKSGADNRFIEGKILSAPGGSGTLGELVTQISDGVTSAISYSGYRDLESFIGNGIFELKYKGA